MKDTPGMPESQRPTRVVIADDHPAIIDAIARYFSDEEDVELIGRASDGAQALQQIETASARRRDPRHPDAEARRDRDRAAAPRHGGLAGDDPLHGLPRAEPPARRARRGCERLPAQGVAALRSRAGDQDRRRRWHLRRPRARRRPRGPARYRQPALADQARARSPQDARRRDAQRAGRADAARSRR